VPFGPAGFGGTPGLILEVSKYRYTLRLKKIKLSNKTITIKKPIKGCLVLKYGYRLKLNLR
jgi:GLPGLI family protein